MKKIIKWSLITGLIICLLGVGMITAGAMMGGSEGLVSYMRSHHSRFAWDDEWDYDDYEDWAWETVSPDQPVSRTDQGTRYDNVRKLKIEAAVGSVDIKEEYRENPEDTTLRIVRYAKDGERVQRYVITQEREELKIECERYHNVRKPYEIESIVIYIPEGYRFRKVEVETLAGAFYADVLNADEADLELKAGEIQIRGGEIGFLDVECQAGRLECNALVTGSADVECQAGSVDISMAGSKDQYNYELECKTGSIELIDTERETYDSLWQKKYIDHRADKTVELDCAAGKINIHFPDTI